MSEARLNIRVSQEFLDRLRQASENKGVTLTAFVTSSLTEVLEGKETSELKDEIRDLKGRLEKLEKQFSLLPIGG
jgi:uncharacterized protein (DUF1778 family)